MSKLDNEHKQRIKNNVEFGYIADDIEYFKAHHDDKSVSLVESERVTKQDDEDKKELERTNERLQAQGLKPVKSLDDVDDKMEAPDPYLDEAVLITLDLAHMDQIAHKKTK